MNSQQRDKRDDSKQKKDDSPQKVNHTRKSQLIVLPLGKDIVNVVAGKPGAKSNISMFNQSQNRFDIRLLFDGDKAVKQGKSIKTPKKKPYNKELTIEDKQKNKQLASERIFVEHKALLLKNFSSSSGIDLD